MLLAIAMAIWIAIMFAIRREYPQVLRQALHKRLLSEGELDLKEAAAIGVIRAKLDSEHPSEVVYALALLERVGEPDLGAAIGAALQHESPLVRQEGARRAGRLELQQLTTQLQQIAHHDSDKKTRAEAVTALGVLAGQSVQSDLTGYLDGDDATLQAAAIAGLLQSKGELSQRQAISALAADGNE